jgi:hypothetical protein
MPAVVARAGLLFGALFVVEPAADQRQDQKREKRTGGAVE